MPDDSLDVPVLDVNSDPNTLRDVLKLNACHLLARELKDDGELCARCMSVHAGRRPEERPSTGFLGEEVRGQRISELDEEELGAQSACGRPEAAQCPKELLRPRSPAGTVLQRVCVRQLGAEAVEQERGENGAKFVRAWHLVVLLSWTVEQDNLIIFDNTTSAQGNRDGDFVAVGQLEPGSVELDQFPAVQVLQELELVCV